MVENQSEILLNKKLVSLPQTNGTKIEVRKRIEKINSRSNSTSVQKKMITVSPKRKVKKQIFRNPKAMQTYSTSPNFNTNASAILDKQYIKKLETELKGFERAREAKVVYNEKELQRTKESLTVLQERFIKKNSQFFNQKQEISSLKVKMQKLAIKNLKN